MKKRTAGRDRSRGLLSGIGICLLLAVPAQDAFGAEVPVALGYNFNGMVHPGEAGQPDAPDGFRSISDRALIIDGGGMSLDDLTSPASGLSYDINGTAGVLDIVHIGNRNTVDNGNHAFDAMPDADDIGIQPNWLADPDQTTVSVPVSPGIDLDSLAALGLLYQISNGGGDFDVTLGFEDTTTVTVTLNGPDWFGPFAGTPDPPGPGVTVQQNLGTDFTGASQVDSGNAGETLIVTEAVVTAGALLGDLGFDVTGKTLVELTFDNRSNATGGYAVLAATVVGADAPLVAIPTMGHWGLIALGLLLALTGGLLLRRRRSL